MITWVEVFQAVTLALCTWYIRRGSKKDTAALKRGTAAQSTSYEILRRITVLETDVGQIKETMAKKLGIDNRGPARS